jgi:hypothetical protein
MSMENIFSAGADAGAGLCDNASRNITLYQYFQTMFQEPLPKVLAPETPIERLLKHLSKCEPAPFGGHYYFAQRSTDCTDCQEIGG